MSCKSSPLSHRTLARLVWRSSVSWLGLKTEGFSYQNLKLKPIVKHKFWKLLREKRWYFHHCALTDLQGKGATCNTQICSKPIRTCSRPLVDTGMSINASHNPKLPPLATPKVGDEQNPTLQNHVKLTQNEEKHMPFEPFCWLTKTTSAIHPQSWGWKKSNLQKRMKLIRNEEKRLLFQPFLLIDKNYPC